MEDDTWKNEPQLEEEIDTLNDETFGVDVNNLSTKTYCTIVVMS